MIWISKVCLGISLYEVSDRSLGHLCVLYFLYSFNDWYCPAFVVSVALVKEDEKRSWIG